ncbi:hypothetical protein SAMN05216464_108145 [Mucilaginibacter pineti]|uniref:Uncharacterized protein n=1 Tax=Mucilaginibacter pineti TaxID=1391627 RepID=A0A1G7ESN0_9SPHI|nr:hypothetical protein [Mucilaginibacter pineti]SDE66647.1 hypothetical protein SAMN05216464_108145 [Mucilaginibacter pineti]
MRRAKRRLERLTTSAKTKQVKSQAEQFGFGYSMPPEPEFVAIYFDQQGCSEQADRFYRHYQNERWKTVTGADIRNWKVLAADWIFDHRQHLKRQARLSKYHSII